MTEINPYRAPDTVVETASVTAVGRSENWTVGEVMSDAWRLVYGCKASFVGAMFLYLAILIAISVLKVLLGLLFGEVLWVVITGEILGQFLIVPLITGLSMMAIKRVRGEDISATDCLEYYAHAPTLFLAMLLAMILMMLGSLLILPGIYLLVGYLYAQSLIVDRGQSIWGALEMSRRAVHRRWFSVALCSLIAFAALMAGLVTVVGLAWMAPFAGLVLGVVYNNLFGSPAPEDALAVDSAGLQQA